MIDTIFAFLSLMVLVFILGFIVIIVDYVINNSLTADEFMALLMLVLIVILTNVVEWHHSKKNGE